MKYKDHNFFDDILNAGDSDCGQPYQPIPPDEVNGSDLPKVSYNESSKNVETIGGTSIEFGEKELIHIDGNNAFNFKNNQTHILGDGILVTGLKPANKDGSQLPGVGGACAFCRIEAMTLLQNGLIDMQEAERRSLFSTKSGSECQVCGRKDLCLRHCRPAEVGGNMVNLCPVCAKQIKDGKWISAGLNFLFSLFGEDDDCQPRQLPPAQEDIK